MLVSVCCPGVVSVLFWCCCDVFVLLYCICVVSGSNVLSTCVGSVGIHVLPCSCVGTVSVLSWCCIDVVVVLQVVVMVLMLVLLI